MLRTLLVLAAALVWAASASAAETDDVARWEQAPRVFDPGAVDLGIRQVAKGGLVFEAPLRWMKSLRLQADVPVTFAENAVRLPAGTQLPLVRFITKAQPTTLRYAYCTRLGIINTESAFISDVWLFKAPFNAKGKQLCLEDTDKDGRLDRSFVKTIQHIMGRPDIIYTGPVSHDAAGAITFDPIDGGTDTLKFVVKGISKTKVQAWIEITVLGGWMNFSRLQTGGYDLRALHEFKQPGALSDILGLEVRLTGFDAVAKKSEFDLRAAGNRGPIIIPDFVAAY